MDKLIKVLQIIYYIIWIPLGLLLVAFIIYMMVANPLGRIMGGGMGGPGGGFGGPPGGGGSNFPSEEMMKEFMQKGGLPQGGNKSEQQR